MHNVRIMHNVRKITFRVKMLITGILYAYPTDELNFILKPIIGFNKLRQTIF